MLTLKLTVYEKYIFHDLLEQMSISNDYNLPGICILEIR